MSPSVMFDKNNIIGKELMSDDLNSMMGTSPFFTKYRLDMTDSGFLGQGSFPVCRCLSSIFGWNNGIPGNARD